MEAVTAKILVSPGLLRGEGEIRIFLKPEVLDGAEVRIQASGETLAVAFYPPTPDVAQLIEQNRPQLEARLTEHIQAFHVTVTVNKGKNHETV